MEVITTQTWCYLDVGLCIVTKYSSINFTFSFTSNDDVIVYVTN
jgi:hypothetical protein